MTLKRKLSLAAVLVVILAVGLIAVSSEREPGPPFTVKFLRYEGSNNVVIEIENKTGHEQAFETHIESLLFEANQVNFLASPGEIEEVTIRLSPIRYLMDKDRSFSSFGLPMIKVSGVLRPSRLESFSHELLQYVGITPKEKGSYDVSVDLPPP